MDLIERLSTDCGLSEYRARALAGGFFAILYEGLGDRFGFETARSFATEVPEAEQWRVDSMRFLGGPNAHVPGSRTFQAALAGDESSHGIAVRRMLDRLEASEHQARAMAPVVYQFLELRLSPILLDRVLELSALMRRAQAEVANRGPSPMPPPGAAG